MNLSFHALWMLCGLGSAVFATALPTYPPGPDPVFTAFLRWRRPGAMALSFAATVAWVQPERLPDSVWTSALVSIVAALQVLRSGPIILTTVTAGALAGIWSALLRIQGLPFVPALIVAAALPALSAYLTAWRPTFAPASLRDEALLGVLVFGLAVAVSPGVSSGWRSATALNLQGNHIVSQIPPGWVLGLVGASVALGGLYSLWVRHRTS